MSAEEIPFSADLVAIVAGHFWEIEGSGDGILSIVFGVIGAGIVIYSTLTPSFQARVEPLGAPAALIG